MAGVSGPSAAAHAPTLVPTSAQVSARFSRFPRRDTTPELALRRRLHAMGLRYRVDQAPEPSLRRRADVVFRGARVAVFVDGCFWHGCARHGVQPRANAAWWRDKIGRTKARDRDTDARLRAAGWRVVRVWEHDSPDEAASVVAAAVRAT